MRRIKGIYVNLSEIHQCLKADIKPFHRVLPRTTYSIIHPTYINKLRSVFTTNNKINVEKPRQVLCLDEREVDVFAQFSLPNTVVEQVMSWLLGIYGIITLTTTSLKCFNGGYFYAVFLAYLD